MAFRGKNRSGFVLAAAAALLLVLPGCWDNVDINHRSLPIIMGVSKHDGQYKVFLQIPDPDPQAAKLRIVSATGHTINEIINDISTNMETRVDLLHLKIILFERSFAEEGVNDSVASFMRGRDISPKAMAVICNEPLERFFDRLTKYENRGGLMLYHYFGENAGWNPQLAQTRIWEMFRSMHSYTNDVVVPVIQSGSTTAIASAGSALIKRGRMVELISPDDMLLINVFMGRGAQGKIEVMDHVDVLIVGNRIRHAASMSGNVPVLKSRLRLKVSVLETKGDLTRATIEKELDALMTKRFDRLLEKMKRNEADILGLGQLFRAVLPRERLADWRTEYLPRLKGDFQTEVILQNTGNLKLDGHEEETGKGRKQEEG